MKRNYVSCTEAILRFITVKPVQRVSVGNLLMQSNHDLTLKRLLMSLATQIKKSGAAVASYDDKIL